MFSPLLRAPFPPQNAIDRDALLAWIRGVSLVYGPWKSFKRLFKDVEAAYSSGARETEIFAALLARLEPREVFRYTPPAPVYSYNSQLWIQGRRLIYGNAQTLRVFDLQNPREPRFLFETSAGEGNNIAVAGDQVVVAASQNLRVLNWPASGDSASGDSVSGDSVSSDSASGVAALTEAGRAPLPYAYQLAAKPGLVAVSHYNPTGRSYQITFFDVSNPDAPTQISQINEENPTDWRFSGDVLVRIGGEDLLFTDLSNPKNPRPISKIRLRGARNFHVVGDKIYVFCSAYIRRNGNYGYENRLCVIDIAHIHSPRLIGEFESQAGEMASHGDLLYVVDNGLKILDVSDAARIQPVGQRPRNATFAYLKRRSRRFLRILSEADQSAFIELAAAFLIEAGRNRDALDLQGNWSSAELVVGGGARWHQSSHGRGAYVRDAAKIAVKTREERAPQAWDAHLGAARVLWNHPHLPWQTQEMALKILRSHRENPAPTSAQIARFLWSNSPALLNFAARAGRARLGDLETRAFAPLLWIVNPSQRREVLAFIEANAELKTATATHLATLLGQNAATGLSRRAREIALLVAARFDLSDPQFDADGAFPAISLLIASAEAPLRALGLDFCRRLSAPRALDALGALMRGALMRGALMGIPLAQRENFVASLLESASRGAFAARSRRFKSTPSSAIPKAPCATPRGA